MEDFVKRMVTEKEDLMEKIDKLEDFLKSEKVNNLSEFEINKMYIQLERMKEYFGILCSRIGYYITNE